VPINENTVNRYGHSVQFDNLKLKKKNIKMNRCESLVIVKELLTRMGLYLQRIPHPLTLTPKEE